jgi:3-isopropylmalate dehydrogenase
MKATIVILPGDGIGPEVTAGAKAILEALAARSGHEFQFEEHPLGGIAIDLHGTALPQPTLAACRAADAVLLGAVGGPKWDDPEASVRPEQGLLGLRKALGLYANLRPVQTQPALVGASPIKSERLQGVDMLIVRELTSGIYFGQPSLSRRVNGQFEALDTMAYTESEVRRVAHLAFQLASKRHGVLTSVDKANVLECSRLWRRTVTQVAEDYPQVTLEHLLVDAAAMHLLTRPASFDVIVTANLFGDILSDEAAVLTGSLGNLPSAALGMDANAHGRPLGLYEPIHGSAPDIAGLGTANPVGSILSSALLLRHSLGLEDEAQAIENAVGAALASGCRTADLAQAHENPLSTQEMTSAIKSKL